VSDCEQDIAFSTCSVHYLPQFTGVLASADVRRSGLLYEPRGEGILYCCVSVTSRSGANYKFMFTAAARVVVYFIHQILKFGLLGDCREVSRVVRT